MIKKILVAIAVALPLLASAQTLKIGVVDVNTIIMGHPDTAAAQTKLNDTNKKYEDEGKKLMEEAQRKYEEFEKGQSSDLPAIRERKARELQEYETKIQQFQQTASQDLQRMQAELMQPILNKVQQAIESVAKEGNYSLIQALDMQTVFYHAAPVVDITNDVKAKLGMK